MMDLYLLIFYLYLQIYIARYFGFAKDFHYNIKLQV